MTHSNIVAGQRIATAQGNYYCGRKNDTNGSKKILQIGMILGEKIERKVYVNQQNFVLDIQVLIKH